MVVQLHCAMFSFRFVYVWASHRIVSYCAKANSHCVYATAMASIIISDDRSKCTVHSRIRAIQINKDRQTKTSTK